MLVSNSAAASPPCFCWHSFVLTLSFKSGLNQDEKVAGKVAAEGTHSFRLELEPTDSAACSRGESECRARTANQLIPMSPAPKKCSVDWPIRTEITESITDWANKTRVTGFLPILNTEAWWENTEISSYSQTTSLTNSCLWGLWHFFQIEPKKVIDVIPKLPAAALNKLILLLRISFKNKHFERFT